MTRAEHVALGKLSDQALAALVAVNATDHVATVTMRNAAEDAMNKAHLDCAAAMNAHQIECAAHVKAAQDQLNGLTAHVAELDAVLHDTATQMAEQKARADRLQIECDKLKATYDSEIKAAQRAQRVAALKAALVAEGA